MNLVLRLYNFLKNRRIVLVIFVVTLLALFVVPLTKIKFEEDISRFLPKTAGIDKINEAMQGMKIKDKLLINLHLKDSNEVNEQSLSETADIVADSLNNHFDSTIVSELKYKQSEESFQALFNIYNEHMPVFTGADNYARLESVLNADSIDNIVKTAYQNLISPTGIVTGKFIESDPLNITLISLKSLKGLQLDDNVDIVDGYFYSRSHKNLLMFLTPAFKSADMGKNANLVDYMEVIRANINKISGGKVVLEYYGAPAVALANSRCIKKDTQYITIFAIFIIALLLILYYRSARSMLILLLPVVFGALFSLTLIYLLKGSISLIAMGAGSIVFGIAINYSLHILTHYKHHGSVEVVIHDLFLPMLLGCTTTVAAFLSLVFVKSEALHDFGMFAGFSLIGTLFFSFIILPHLFSRKEKSVYKQTILDKMADWQPHKKKWIVVIVIVGSLFLAYFSGGVQFEKDMRSLNYETPELKLWHANLEKINNFTKQSVFVAVRGNNIEEALQKNERVNEGLEKLKADFPSSQIAGLAGILLSEKEQLNRINRWKEFWTKERIEALKSNLNRSGNKYGFTANAFDPFLELLSAPPKMLNGQELEDFAKIIGSGMFNVDKGKATIYSIVKTSDGLRNKLYSSSIGQSDTNVTVFDNVYITGLFTEAVTSDFLLILLITAMLVFGFMLLSHGRIETTMINFLPMLVSWLCILGIMSLFGIKFNLINIIISTFVFGLGDDYSIFILDGMATEYKYGRKILNSYKSSILLSAITTIIGTGALIFASHPALRSISIIAVLGLVIVIVVSFVIQPLIYNWMILNRVKKGLPPYTALNLIITFIGFLVFTLGSVLLTLLGWLLFYGLVFVNKKRRKVWFHSSLMWVNRFILACFINVKKTIINQHGETFKKPAIIVANHQSHIDLALIMQLYPKIIFFTNDWVWKSPFYGKIVQMADFYPASKGYENAVTELQPLIDDGYSIMIFPEGTRSKDGNIHRFHKGAFYLQEKLGLDILPILIHGAGDCVTKGDFHFKNGRLTVKILPRIPADISIPYKENARKICDTMRMEYSLLKSETEDVGYFRSKLISNYIYKGPVLEWYTRIKTKMEKNYTYFDSLLPPRGVITDVGCGYGYLSYMLAYKSPEREITGIDYDEDKINMAKNCFSNKQSEIDFICADITQFDLPKSDAILALDVLHYLKPEKQVQVIHGFLDALKEDGVLVIRDANAEMKKKHRFTRYTEFFSTNSGFNKITANGLSFVSSQWIDDAVKQKGGFTFEIVDQTKYLSNLIYLIKHKK